MPLRKLFGIIAISNGEALKVGQKVRNEFYDVNHLASVDWLVVKSLWQGYSYMASPKFRCNLLSWGCFKTWLLLFICIPLWKIISKRNTIMPLLLHYRFEACWVVNRLSLLLWCRLVLCWVVYRPGLLFYYRLVHLERLLGNSIQIIFPQLILAMSQMFGVVNLCLQRFF